MSQPFAPLLRWFLFDLLPWPTTIRLMERLDSLAAKLTSLSKTIEMNWDYHEMVNAEQNSNDNYLERFDASLLEPLEPDDLAWDLIMSDPDCVTEQRNIFESLYKTKNG